MSVIKRSIFKTPVVRVFDKEANIRFYQEVLGFKLHSEENALAIFTSYANANRTFIIEESPTYRTRAVVGTRKHHKTVIKVLKPEEIEYLLAKDIQVDTVFKGEKGYAFEATSPEGYTYLLHAEDDTSHLVVASNETYQSGLDFQGLSDFVVEELVLNVPDVQVAQAFYRKLDLPLIVSFVAATGQDLQANPDEVWDLEYVEFNLPVDVKLSELREALEALSCPIEYEDKRLLVIKDTSNIAIWFNQL